MVWRPTGVYVSQILQPEPVEVSGSPRIPCYVGRGHRYARVRNSEIIRSFIYEESLTVSGILPHTATLNYNSDEALDTSVLYRSDGTIVPQNRWWYNSSSQIQIDASEFDITETYTFDYQSIDRTPLDPLPVTQIRNPVQIGRTLDREAFDEFVDYKLPMTITGDATDTDALEADPGNTYPTPSVVIDNTGATSTGTIVEGASSNWTHNYRRRTLLVTSAPGGVAPNRTMTITWFSAPGCPGNDNLPGIPLDIAEATEWRTDTITEGVNDTDYPLDFASLNLTVDFVWGATQFGAGDSFTIDGLGPGLLEFDLTHINTNQFIEAGSVTKEAGAGLGTLSLDASGYTPTGQRKYWFECIAVGATTDFMYGIHKEVSGAAPYIYGTANLTFTGTTATLTLDGIVFTFDITVGVFADGDIFSVEVKPPRNEVTFHDDRSYELTVTSVALGDVDFQWVTDTPEGGAGTASSDNMGYLNPTGSTTGLSGNFKLHARNVEPAGGDLTKTMYASGDKFTCSVACDDTIDWSLLTAESETIEDSDIVHDVTGSITGTADTYYVVLQHTPSSIQGVTSGGSPLSYSQVPNTPYIWFSTDPGADVVVNYRWVGEEPAPGDTYYLTANYLRPDSMYNIPTKFTSYEAALNWVSPVDGNNDLYVMLSIIEPLFKAGLQAIYLCQVKDADGDGVYTDVDFQEGIDGSELRDDIRDLVVLNHFTTLNYQLNSVSNMNDPYVKKPRLTWIGAPVGTDVGDSATADTLVYIAKNTLQVYGNDPAHGSRIMVAPTTMTKTVNMQDGTTKLFTLDGSFLAGYLAARVAAFSSPTRTLLRKTIGVFDSIETFEGGDINLIGEAQMVYCISIGSGVYRIEQATTTDRFANHTKYISAMCQKHNINQAVQNRLDEVIISLVPVSPRDAAKLIRGEVGGVLTSELAKGNISPYLDDDGNERPFDPDTDVLAYQDETSRTLYWTKFSYFLRYEIERIYGLAMADSNDFGNA